MNMLLKKVSKRLKKVFVRVVPSNLNYKPKGYYKTIKDFIASNKEKGAECVEVYSEYISNNNIPQDFLDQCTKYNELPSVATIPASKLVAIPNGRLYSDGVEFVSIITPDNKVLGEVTYQNKPSNDVEQNVLLKQQFFIPPRHYKGVVFHMLIGGSGATNYFHWLFDCLPRIHFLQKSSWFNKVDWFLVPGNRVDYQKESLRMLGIPEAKIITGEDETHIQADVLLASTYVRYFEHIPTWCCNFLRDNFLKPELFTKLKTHPFVYISRKDATRRRIVNEPELLNLLEKYGFKAYELTSLSFIEKIQLFNHAKVLIAIHGAGQANLVFCNEGTDVLEIIAKHFAFPIFYDISNKVGLNFDYIMSETEKGKPAIQSNIIVDLDEVKDKLDKIMTRDKMNKQSVLTKI